MTSWKWIRTLQTFDSSPFIGQGYFNNYGAQLYLIFQPEWESKGLSNEKFKPPYTASKIFLQNWYGILA